MSYSPQKSSLGILQPAPAWTAILGFVFCSVLLILVGAGKILNLVFPAGAFVVAVFLYFRAPILYLGFTWWLCFLSPFVRRLADYRSGFTDPSPILLAPFLVVLVTLVTLYQHLPKAHRQGGLPFILCFTSIFFGICLGFVRTSPIAVGIAGLTWLTPVLLSFHLFVNWRDYPSYRQNIQRVFFWGVLVMGVYGVFQYLVAPEWDQFWLNSTEMWTAGKPKSLGIRVWSTMNAYYTFAVFMMAGLLILINQTGVLSISASAVGYLTLLLAKSRTVWLGWFGALLIIFSSLKSKHQIRLIIIVMMITMLLVPLISIDSFSENITSRIETLSSLEDDRSGQTRLGAYDIFFSNPLMALIGIGIGNKEESLVWDSGILAIFSSLGWFGGILYLSGMLKLIFELWQFSRRSRDQFANIASGVSMSILFMIPLASSHAGVHGICLWSFLGMGLAGRKYYQNQRAMQINQSSREIYNQ
ncbi:MAG: O-antigen ligase domain-containing protein [Xenococcaceae cyanobacterium MO_167.B27]|nr:O-antigen ligase domain-containing protein [Xenococcaceae cyanobacterium MO_167.B27]